MDYDECVGFEIRLPPPRRVRSRRAASEAEHAAQRVAHLAFFVRFVGFESAEETLAPVVKHGRIERHCFACIDFRKSLLRHLSLMRTQPAPYTQ
ncbi:hypothetical protein M3A49_31420 [Paraburkholderia sp. CNPSo 3076]|uniref:hypothetical protein n=1 Tax=Paraburkholderia sp. CNPSo 3076 TaxID=2940936 RepID=UPI00224D55EF|nr:hypothetical protein [Paraburkholderia sp. CNPSo 3076]MCX5543939.1 hypothetical protein [Paraburkholderia sp. CNPSo 3076]